MESFLPWRGNYRNLLVYRKSVVIYDLTYLFARKYLDRSDRTVDQMIQAARSCKQNIVEGVAASTTSAEMEIKLVNVAKASLQELMEDFIDYLRVRRLPMWQRGDDKFERSRRFCTAHSDPADYVAWMDKASPEALCNVGLILSRQTDYLLFRYIESVKSDFLKRGGIREQMARARIQSRSRKPEN